MIIYLHYKTEYKPFATYEVNLRSPLTGDVSPLRLVLYAAHVSTFMSVSVPKKPTATYTDLVTGEDIPAAHWTDEMEAFYREKTSCIAVPGAGMHLKLGGKIFLAFAIAVVLAITGIVIYETTFKQWAKNNATEEVMKLPVVGDRYHVALPIERVDASGKPIASGVEILWCSVEEVRPDGTYLLRIVEALPNGAHYTKSFQEYLNGEDSFLASFQVTPAADRSSYPDIVFTPLGYQEGLPVFFFGTLENAKQHP